MKKQFVMAVLLLVVMISFGQIKGVNFANAHPSEWYGDVETPDGEFIRYMGNEGMIYSYMYGLTAVAYKHCIEKVGYILDNNGGIRLPDYDNSLLPSYVENEYAEYLSMATAIKIGTSEIDQRWFLDCGYIVVLMSNEHFIGISLWKENKPL